MFPPWIPDDKQSDVPEGPLGREVVVMLSLFAAVSFCLVLLFAVWKLVLG